MTDETLSEQRRLLIGSYFLAEYSLESAAQFYYATFTAFDGKVIVPELLETSDFRLFRFITLNGPAPENRGMAIFPGSGLDGLYAMLSG